MRSVRAFTLIEVLVVVAIISVLSSIVLVSLNIARENGRIGAGKKQDAAIYHALGADAVAVWDFDEGTGTFVADNSGNGNNGTWTLGTWASSTPYGRGSSASFNNSVYVGFSNPRGLPASTVTVTAWIYLTQHRNWANIVNNGWIGNGWLLYSAEDGLARFGVAQGGVQYGSRSKAALSLNAWHFLVGTYDGSKITLYVDGAAQDPALLSNAVMTTGSQIQVGGGTIGYIDQVRIYANTLKLAEIRSRYVAERPLTIASLSGWFR